MGVLITLEEPSKPMLREAAEAGLYRSPAYDKGFDRIQILTIEQLLAGKQIEYPRLVDATFKKAPKAKGAVAQQLGLDV